ncbi:MAG: hypothetical protein WCI34_03565, partial [Actinomycetes bacterium]
MLTARASASFSLVLMISYLLGAFGAFSLAPLAIGFLVTGPLGQFILKPPSSSQAQEIDFPARLGIPLAVGGMALISVWMLSVRFALWEGITGTDSLWYHMPFAVHFYQSESLMGFDFAEPLFQTYFYPSSGSLFHALGMVFFDRDFLTPLVNLGWLGFAILAGAAIGSERKVAATSALGVAAVFAGEGVLRGSAGSAMVDTPATFFFLAAVLLMIKRPQTRAALLLSGLAVGAGVSVKLTIIAPAALLGIAVV